MANIAKQDNNLYRVVLVKTIDNTEPIYYRLVKLSDYSIEDIPAYRIMDEIISKGKHIENIRCENNKLYILDDDNYVSTLGVVTLDEFDKRRPNAYDWAMGQGELGKKLIKSYSVEFNTRVLSSYEIDSHAKMAWTCSEGHTIWCGLPTFFGTGCKCPLCEAKNNKDTMSLKYWCNITNNREILKAYDGAGVENNKDSEHIAWNSRKKVKFRGSDNTYQEYCLADVTSGKVRLDIQFVDYEDDSDGDV
jgi:hypothetical protein